MSPYGKSDAEEAWRPPAESWKFLGNRKWKKIRCIAGPIYPKAAVASCIAMTSSAYNGTPVQPQPHAMGTARREPRRGESPGADRQIRFCQPPLSSGEVVSNTDRKKFWYQKPQGSVWTFLIGPVPVFVVSNIKGEDEGWNIVVQAPIRKGQTKPGSLKSGPKKKLKAKTK